MTSSPDQPKRVLFLGTPDDPGRWAELGTRLAALDVETTHSLDGEFDYAVIAEDILDGYCTADEALALQKLRVRDVPWVCAGTDVDHIVAAVSLTESDEVEVLTIAAPKGSAGPAAQAAV